MADNSLYYGDCLDILRGMPAESVDLIYLDPPFNSKRDYNAIFKSEDGKRPEAQVIAFKDTWQWTAQAELEWLGLLKNPDAAALGQSLLPALRQFLGESEMMAYLVMMASRLVELKRVLKPRGSVYLHCDPTASHYLKLVMDHLFGKCGFRNEIAWIYSRMAARGQKQFSRCHDVIFWYSKGNAWTFNVDSVRLPYSAKSKAREGHKKTNLGGGTPASQRCELNPLGKFPEDWWQIPFLRGREYLGYPTQKPLALLERIIKASSNPGYVVLDPFCGCGTAVHAAEKLGRKWIGIDITHLAIALIQRRMRSAFPNCGFEVKGTPQDVESARFLATSNGLEGRYQFQYWALSLVDAMPAQDKKKGADKGQDGYIWACSGPDPDKDAFKINISVKSGKIPDNHIRELKGMLGEGGVEMCALITLEPPSATMLSDAVAAGFYECHGHEYQRIQILTIQELLDGKKLDYLDLGDGRAMPKKARREVKRQRQGKLDG